MKREQPDHCIEFLLDFAGQRHVFEQRYSAKFEIQRVTATAERPHGLSYSFTLHAPDGSRLMGFDNAHRVPARTSRLNRWPQETDHWHATENDPGRPYQFKDAETLLADFFDAVKRVLTERGIELKVIKTEDTRKPQ
jgi:hypothetical protein